MLQRLGPWSAQIAGSGRPGEYAPGPGGGACPNPAGTEPASRALRNYLHFQPLDGEQVYPLRKVIEVELAV
ncbi:Transcriptional regulator, GntR family [Pseudomonas sp. LBUM920]|nr:Transcriptional regulator, GntR family [Pseudomonas sp. LBUM920]